MNGVILTCQKLIVRADSDKLSLCALFMNESLFARTAIHVGLVLQNARGAEAGQRGRRVGRQDGEGEEGDAGEHDHLPRNKSIKSEWRIINPLEKLEVGNYISVGYSIRCFLQKAL